MGTGQSSEVKPTKPKPMVLNWPHLVRGKSDEPDSIGIRFQGFQRASWYAHCITRHYWRDEYPNFKMKEHALRINDNVAAGDWKAVHREVNDAFELDSSRHGSGFGPTKTWVCYRNRLSDFELTLMFYRAQEMCVVGGRDKFGGPGAVNTVRTIRAPSYAEIRLFATRQKKSQKTGVPPYADTEQAAFAAVAGVAASLRLSELKEKCDKCDARVGVHTVGAS